MENSEYSELMLMEKRTASHAYGTITACSLTRAVEERAGTTVSLELGTRMVSRHRKPVGTKESTVAIGYSGVAPREGSSISMTKEKPRFSISSIGLTNRRILLLFPDG